MQNQSIALTSPVTAAAPVLAAEGDLFTHARTHQVLQPNVNETRASQLIAAAEGLLAVLCQGEALGLSLLRRVMVSAFGGSDSEGAWNWKDVYEAQEIAALLFVRKYREALAQREPLAVLATLEKLQSLLATHTRRSDRSQRWQQFSTPLPLGYVVARAAGLGSDDVVLEPSAGTGLLAVFAEGAAAALHINELEPKRRALLTSLFPHSKISDHNAEYIDDLLPRGVVPSVVLMNPPFSTSPTMTGSNPAVTGRHVITALNRLAEGGRMVAITGRNFAPNSSKWRDAFVRLQGIGRIVFSAPLAGKLYAKHGTSFETRLTVIDKLPADDPKDFSTYHPELVETTTELLRLITRSVPARRVARGTVTEIKPAKAPNVKAAAVPLPVPVPVVEKPKLPLGQGLPGSALSRHTVALPGSALSRHTVALPGSALSRNCITLPGVAIDITEALPLAFQTLDWQAPNEELQDCLYETYTPQSVEIDGAKAHPTPLVQSAAMASVAPPKPTYVPDLPQRLITEGVLSDAQLESIIYAGEAHNNVLPGSWTINQHYDLAGESEIDADAHIRSVQFRQGWFLGDGTGCGKGRQVAGIILDNRLKGRTRALWVSKNDKLLEDARRDWAALGGDPAQVVPLSRFRQAKPIDLNEGILFLTYGTLRSAARGGKASRLDQIVEWLGPDFDGPLMFDESHALANATSAKGERGVKAASKQGQAGLRLQRALPLARVAYVSATGATEVGNLAYAERLGLWGEDTAFQTRSDFVAAMEAGGVAAMEVISRDLKAMGLYTARSLSYDGVEVDILEHTLGVEQVEIYDAFAEAYHIIHQNLQGALEALNISSGNGTLNKNAKAAALSAFESSKQRFFSHMLTALKCPSLIKAIEADIKRGDAVIVQLVSTGEALLERRLATIPGSEWNDLTVDITPREYVLDYLGNSFPTQLFELYSDEDGKPCSRPLFDADGNPVINRAAEVRRDAMIEHLAGLPAVPTALDQIVHHFGTDAVAEVTGRSLRLVREDGVVKVQKRPASSNLTDAQAYMDDKKRILIFSDAGGTGRSYHADLDAKNSRRRVHYLLEPGWRADNAIQGLGRSNRTNQSCPPLFRPVATDVKGEKRFLSTIARRLDSLGAITKGQRQTGGQGMFRAEDNLESPCARAALRQLYRQIVHGEIADCSLTDFEDQTGLSLLDSDGSVREELPPMSRFLNRVLALTIARQNSIFEAFETVLEQILEGLRATGGLDVGVETLQGDSFTVAETRMVYTHGRTGAETSCIKINRRDRVTPTGLAEALEGQGEGTAFMVNAKSGRAALRVPGRNRMTEAGAVQPCVRLIRPLDRNSMTEVDLAASTWQAASLERFREAWAAELATLPEYQTSSFYLVTGLLLPIWDRMGKDSLRINRLQTDDGHRLLGRVLREKDLPAFYTALGLDAPELSIDSLWRSVLEDGAAHSLARGLRLRRSRIMAENRVELSFDGGSDIFTTLTGFGCMTEIISYKRRAFIPTGAQGPDILARVLERFPLTVG